MRSGTPASIVLRRSCQLRSAIYGERIPAVGDAKVLGVR